MKSLLLATMSHQLWTPVDTMIDFAQGLRSRLGDPDQALALAP